MPFNQHRTTHFGKNECGLLFFKGKDQLPVSLCLTGTEGADAVINKLLHEHVGLKPPELLR